MSESGKSTTRGERKPASRAATSTRARPATGAQAHQGQQNQRGGDVVTLRRDFTQDVARAAKRTLLISVGCLLAASALATFAVMKKERTVYIAADEGGRIINLIPLSSPNHSDPVVANWVTRALVGTFQFNFDNYQYSLNESVQEFFTSEGGSRLIQELDRNGTISTIRDRELLLSLVVDQVPIITDKGPIEGGRFFAWQFQVPATLTFRNTRNQSFTNRVVFTVTVARRSVLEDPNGLGITRIVMTQRD
ncbi:intracellular multiplication protein IcmL [Natronocella acetinitrilica]|uniref:Intracellular multiplication protein IcmL n=1 Tax=Natronocella acetinitrilica TaxID=414046 RepID=A0AAE3G2L9_9GAMM|nr:DotI/IcmL/TraM family protein [Natronocella acetinitrilica]MCP1674282.1 intracellular multiplication protein IcmL [Natronocella acetinitrilica]